MFFAVNTLYDSEMLEAIVSAFLIVLAVKSFDYILKSLLTSPGRHCVSTSHYALSLAADQAWNPFNYIKWWCGANEFGEYVQLSNGQRDSNRNAIPLQRATLAVFIVLFTLLAEAAFFWGTMSTKVFLTDGQLKLQMRQSNTNHGTPTEKNTCKPILLGQARAELLGVFAACNIASDLLPPFGPGTQVQSIIERNHYSIAVVFKYGDNVTISSRTTFTLLVQKGDNLVIRLNGSENLKAIPSGLIYDYYQKDAGCTLDRFSGNVGNFPVENCERQIDPTKTLQIIVRYIETMTTGIAGNDVGKPQGDNLFLTPGNVRIGSIAKQNFTAVGVLTISLILLFGALVCCALVRNDTAEVLGCMLRERTGMHPQMATFAMGEGRVEVKRRYMDDEDSFRIVTVGSKI